MGAREVGAFTGLDWPARETGRRLRSGGLPGFLGALAACLTLYPLVLRPRLLRWGATELEAGAQVPGDEIVAQPVYQVTRAVTVNAPANRVWPWLAQIGQGRGGLYSYDWLENLLGMDIHSADRIIPEYQDPHVGDTVWLARGRYGDRSPHFRVAAVRRGYALVLRVADAPPSYDSTWAFVITPAGDRRARLLVRWRTYSRPAWAAPLYGVEPLAFIMELGMLRGLKERAERPPSLIAQST